MGKEELGQETAVIRVVPSMSDGEDQLPTESAMPEVVTTRSADAAVGSNRGRPGAAPESFE
jgi:hypothetical protein